MQFDVRALCPLVLAAIAPLAPAAAQPAPGVPTSTQAQGKAPPDRPDWALTVGFAPLVAPPFQGSRDMALSIFPDLRLNYRDDLFVSVPDGLGWNIVNRDGWKIGPLVKLRFGRQESTGGSPFLIAGGSDALRGLGSVGAAGEAGAFVQHSIAGGRVRARAELRQGFGGHDGLVADLTLGWSDSIGGPAGPWRYGVGARASFGDRSFTNVYFGIDAAQSAASGLAISRTGAGLVNAGVNGSLTRLLGARGRAGAVTLFLSHDQLGNPIARSSLIEERGQRGQTAGGLAYGYRFTWG